LLKKLEIKKVAEFEKKFLENLEGYHREVLEKLKNGIFDDEIAEELKNAAEAVINKMNN